MIWLPMVMNCLAFKVIQNAAFINCLSASFLMDFIVSGLFCGGHMQPLQGAFYSYARFIQIQNICFL